MSHLSSGSAESSPAVEYLANMARAYAQYTNVTDFHRSASMDLVSFARVSPGDTVVDLGCGTGLTTKAALGAVGETGRVVGVDPNVGMVQEARRRVRGGNGIFVHGRAEESDSLITDAVDSVVSSSAIWLTRLPETFAAMAALVRRRPGVASFNYPLDPDSRGGSGPPSLPDIAWAIGVLDYGYRGQRNWACYPLDVITALLEGVGLKITDLEVRSYEIRSSDDYHYHSLPLVSRSRFPYLQYGIRQSIIDQAFERCEPTAKRTVKLRLFRCVPA